MTAIRCPICDSFLEGDGEAALTMALRAHLSEVHSLRPQVDIFRSVEPREHSPQRWEEMKRTAPPEGEVGEDVEESILCPFCGSRFQGHDGEELSQGMIAHLYDVHGIKTRGRSLTMVR